MFSKLKALITHDGKEGIALPLLREVSDVNSLTKAYKTIPGMISPQAGKQLHILARSQSVKGVIVEIGSWQGRSTVYLASSITDKNEKMIAIDHFRGNPGKEHWYRIEKDDLSDVKKHFWNHVKQYKLVSSVKLLDMESTKASKLLRKKKTKIRFLFIDGCHDYQGVKADFVNFEPMVVSGGLIVFDDFSEHFSGVVKLIKEIKKSGKVNDVFSLPNTCVVQKK